MNTVQDVQNLERFIAILARIFAVPYQIIETNIARYYKAYKEEKGIDALNDWVDKGGDLSHVEIFAEHVEDISAIFKMNHVPYVTLNTILGNDSPIATVVFRDKDKDLVDDMILGYRSYLSNKNLEVDIYSFKALMENSEIATASNLSIGEVYAFRRAMRDENFMFCVGKDTKNEGKYQIFADDKQGLSKVLAGITYDFNAGDGLYKAQVDKYASQYQLLNSKIGKENFYIVDGAEPKNFTYVQKDKYSIHSLVLTPERQPDGSTIDVVTDPAAMGFESVKTKDLLKIAQSYKKPIIMKEEDFYMVEGVTRRGKAKEAAFFTTKYAQICQQLEHAKPSIIRFPRKPTLVERQDLMGYVHLPQNYLKELLELNSRFYMHYDGSLAFNKADKAIVDDYLAKKLNGLDSLKRFAFTMYINGRSGDNLMDLSGKSENVYFVVNPKNPSEIMRIDNKAAMVLEGGIEVAKVLNTSSGYSEFVEEYLRKFKNPIGFTEQEMMMPGRDELIEALSNGEVKNSAIDFLVKREEHQRNEFIEQMSKEDGQVSKENAKAKDDFKRLNLSARILDKQLFREIQQKHVAKEIDDEIDI